MPVGTRRGYGVQEPYGVPKPANDASTATPGAPPPVSGVASVGGTAPVVSSGGATPNISMAAATASVNGYLLASDWTAFNAKQSTITFSTVGAVPNSSGASIVAGVITLQQASASFPGVVTTAVQAFAGDKTFDNLLANSLATKTNAVGTGTVVNFSIAATNTVTLDNAIRTLTFTAPAAVNTACYVIVTQAPSGITKILNWPASVNAGSFVTIPVQNSAYNSVTVYEFFWDGTTYWLVSATTNPGLSASNGQAKANNYGSALVDKGAITTAVTIDWTAGDHQTFTETTLQNPTITFTAPANPCRLWLKIAAPATGTTGTITWPATVKGSPPTTVTLAKSSALEFDWDGANYYYMAGCLNV